MPVKNLSGQSVEEQVCGIAGVDVLQLVLAQIDRDPCSFGIDECQCGTACGNELSFRQGDIGDDAKMGRGDGCRGQVVLRLLQSGGGGLDGGIVFTLGAKGCRAGAFQIGFGAFELRFRLSNACARGIALCRGRNAPFFQPECAFRLSACVRIVLAFVTAAWAARIEALEASMF